MTTADEQLDLACRLFAGVFAVPGKMRSSAFKHGVKAALTQHSAGTPIAENCHYRPGTVEFDAFSAGMIEGALVCRAGVGCE